MTTARPILMHARSVQNLLAGRKTQTRRILKPAFGTKCPVVNLAEHGESGQGYSGRFNDPFSWGYPYAEDGADMPLGYWSELCPYGVPGDLLWVRECFSYMQPLPQRAWYWADGNPEDGDWTRPKPSIHMPRWASRLTLELTDVRVERVQDISEADACAEGIKPVGVLCTLGGEVAGGGAITAREQFVGLWNDTNGPGAWERNEWVWVLAFKVHRANVDSLLAKAAA